MYVCMLGDLLCVLVRCLWKVGEKVCYKCDLVFKFDF